MALDWQALAAKKAWKAFETCEALEQVAARMKRVMGLTDKVSCPPLAGQLDCRVSGRVEDNAAPKRDCMSKV